MKQILLVEDDPQICEVIETYFRHKQTEICSVHNGSDAMQIVRCSLSAYELVLLDVMLPETDGFTICREIRRRADLPVIFLTARGREEDVLYGYDMGCDDYIVKPFLLSALYAKCMALLRRSDGTVINDLLVCGDIRLNVRMLSCFAGDREIELPPKEFAILRYLMTHEDWTVDRDTLLNRIWGSDYFGSDRVVDNHIKKLRKALGSAGSQIKTVVGRGYKLSEKG